MECAPRPDEALLRTIERSLALAYRVERVELLVAGEPDPAPPADVPAAPPPPAEPAAPREGPEPAAGDGASAAFRRTEEIRKKALAGLQTARPRAKKAPAGKPAGKLLYGRREIRSEPLPMRTLELDMGTVTVRGDVFSVDHRELKKRGAWVVSFDLTDYTGSVRVSKFFPARRGSPSWTG